MRVPGLIFANDKLLEQVKKDQAPEQVANVAFLPGIQVGQPGHAGHPLGLRLLHRRRVRDRPGRGRRHLARAASATTSTAASAWCAPTSSIATSSTHIRDAGRGAVPHRPGRRRQRRASTSSTTRSCSQLLAEGAALSSIGRGLARSARPRAHRGRRPPRRRRSGQRQRPRHQARARAVRHARLRQPLPRSAGRRSRLRRGGRRRRWAWRRTWSA